MRGVARKVSTPQWPGVPAMWFERAAHGSAQRSVDRLPVQSLRSVSHHPDWDRLRENAPSALDGRFDPARDRQGGAHGTPGARARDRAATDARHPQAGANKPPPGAAERADDRRDPRSRRALPERGGKKGEPHIDPDDPPRRRANKRPGHGTYETDRPPIFLVKGRRTGR